MRNKFGDQMLFVLDHNVLMSQKEIEGIFIQLDDIRLSEENAEDPAENVLKVI